MRLLAVAVVTALFMEASAAIAETKYVGNYFGKEWHVSTYKGETPGLGILTFNLKEKNGIFSPLFIKCNDRTFSFAYEDYQSVPPGETPVTKIYNMYC